MSTYLIYGASGYTGELIARAAKVLGHTPVLAGRREAALRPLAEELGFATRAFSLDDPQAVDAGLSGLPLVLNCAGPFAQTAAPMVDGCLRQRVHYLDITGEIDVFESLAVLGTRAYDARITLLPGVGFDVVPTDCLAAHLKRRLPNATQLRLAIQVGMDMSRGTATTTVEGFGRPNLVRRGGILTEVPMGRIARRIDFGAGPTLAVSIPWGDVSTAYHSTGIDDIEVYVATSSGVRAGMLASNLIAPILQTAGVQRLLKRGVQRGAPGPTAEQRASGSSQLWGEASDGEQRVVTRMRAPEAYALTVETALRAVSAVLRGPVSAGFQTPSSAFGADFILQVPGVERLDE